MVEAIKYKVIAVITNKIKELFLIRKEETPHYTF